MNIAGFDLNLLRILVVVRKEQSVSHAARKLGLSQPAVSNAIGRLRKTLNDPIVVRTQSGALLTPRAERLAEAAEEALSLIANQLPAPAEFDPAVARTQFTVLMSDVGALVAAPHIVREMRRRAPGVTLRIRAFNGYSYISELESGQADLVYGNLKRPHSSLMSRRLTMKPWVCLYRADHPFASRTITIDDYFNAYHIAYEKDARGQSMSSLPKVGRERKIALFVSHYISIPTILADTDLVVTVPDGVALAFATSDRLAYQPVPYDASPLPVSIYWHQRATNDEANRWLRSLFHDVLRK